MKLMSSLSPLVFLSKCIADLESAIPFYTIIAVKEYKCDFVLLTEYENLILVYKFRF